MALWFVQSMTSKDDDVVWIQPLSDGHRNTLYSILYNNDTVSSQAKDDLFTVLMDAKRRRHWIACDCESNNGSNPPAMATICQRDSGLYLRRVIGYGEHAHTCMFHRKRSAENSSKNLRPAHKANALFGLYKQSRTRNISAAKPDTRTKPKATAGVQVPRLGRNLFRLLETARLTYLTADLPDIREQYQSLKNATKGIQIADGIPLNDFFFTFPNQVKYAGVKLRQTQARWPRNCSPHAFVFVVADEIRNMVLLCGQGERQTEIRLKHSLHKLSGRLGALSAPYGVLLTVAEYKDSGWFVPIDAFAAPIYSKQLLVPVDSSYERIVLNTLLSVAKSLRKRKVELMIEKPVFDIRISKESYCRPDFILRGNGRTIVLEVGGSHEPEYLARKAETHKIMARIGPVINLDAYEADVKSTWKEALSRLARQIYAGILSDK